MDGWGQVTTEQKRCLTVSSDLAQRVTDKHDVLSRDLARGLPRFGERRHRISSAKLLMRREGRKSLRLSQEPVHSLFFCLKGKSLRALPKGFVGRRGNSQQSCAGLAVGAGRLGIYFWSNFCLICKLSSWRRRPPKHHCFIPDI